MCLHLADDLDDLVVIFLESVENQSPGYSLAASSGDFTPPLHAATSSRMLHYALRLLI